jgi:hypothetical protein
VWDGVYTEEQAKRGQESYKQVCGHCHRDRPHRRRQRSRARRARGPIFTVRWRDQPLSDMFVTIGTTMPKNKPDSVMPGVIIDIVSFILKANDMPAGQHELPPSLEALKGILVTEKTLASPRRVGRSMPRRFPRAAPCMPARRQVGQFEDGWIHDHDFLKPDDARIVLCRVVHPQKLPPVIVFVVRHVQDRGAGKDNRAQTDRRSVSRLVEGQSPSGTAPVVDREWLLLLGRRGDGRDPRVRLRDALAFGIAGDAVVTPASQSTSRPSSAMPSVEMPRAAMSLPSRSAVCFCSLKKSV